MASERTGKMSKIGGVVGYIIGEHTDQIVARLNQSEAGGFLP